jgi:hypothetical protein
VALPTGTSGVSNSSGSTVHVLSAAPRAASTALGVSSNTGPAVISTDDVMEDTVEVSASEPPTASSGGVSKQIMPPYDPHTTFPVQHRGGRLSDLHSSSTIDGSRGRISKTPGGNKHDLKHVRKPGS